MTLPDWSSAINGQINAFLAWQTIQTVVTITVGTAVGAAVVAMFLRVFHR